VGSRRTWWVCSAATADVSSVEASSTTMISSSDRDCAPIAARQSLSSRTQLYAGTMIDSRIAVGLCMFRLTRKPETMPELRSGTIYRKGYRIPKGLPTGSGWQGAPDEKREGHHLYFRALFQRRGERGRPRRSQGRTKRARQPPSMLLVARRPT